MTDLHEPGSETEDAGGRGLVVPRRPVWKYTLAAAAVTAAVSWVALMPHGDVGTAAPHVLPPAEPERERALPAQQPPATTAAARRATSAPGAQRTQPPLAATQSGADARDLQALSSDNAGDRIEALRSIRDRGAVALLPQLLARDPASDPDAAPTLIAAASDLAQHTDVQQRSAAASKLGEWLQRETKRAATDARANVSVIVEALGRLDSPESVRALTEALDSEQLPVHVATLAARGLSKLGDPSARDAVERFRARVAGAPVADHFSRELYAEALAAADSALSQWSQ